jgi:hypothetical protein
MAFIDELIERINDDPEATRLFEDPEAMRLFEEVLRTTAAQKEAARHLRAYFGRAETAKPEAEINPTKAPTMGKRAYDLIVAAKGAIRTTEDLARELGLNEIQVSQGLREFVRKGLIKKPYRGVYQYPGGSNPAGPVALSPKALPAEGTFQRKVLYWLWGQGEAQSTAAIAEGMNHPLQATKSTLVDLRGKGLVTTPDRGLWDADISFRPDPADANNEIAPLSINGAGGAEPRVVDRR